MHTYSSHLSRAFICRQSALLFLPAGLSHIKINTVQQEDGQMPAGSKGLQGGIVVHMRCPERTVSPAWRNTSHGMRNEMSFSSDMAGEQAPSSSRLQQACMVLIPCGKKPEQGDRPAEPIRRNVASRCASRGHIPCTLFSLALSCGASSHTRLNYSQSAFPDCGMWAGCLENLFVNDYTRTN